jgi:histidine triad (HIT) family protein
MATEEEQLEALKKMTPEQIQELQKQQCIFCRIIEGKVQAKKIHEDDNFLAVLDINPATAGHILVMPKTHYAILPQMPEQLIGKLGVLAKKLSQAVLRGLKVQGTTIFVANGMAAGQRAPHVLLHVIPRKEADGIGIALPEHKLLEEDLLKLQTQLKPFFSQAATADVSSTSPSSSHSTPAGSPERLSSSAHKKEKHNEGHKEHKPDAKTDNLDAIAEFLARK